MKKIVAIMLILVMALTVVGPSASAAEGRGGFMGFIAGCCFGIRAAADYNDGMDIHWREWCTLIPYVNIVFAIWNGVDGASGVTRADLAEKYGSQYY